MTTLESVTGGKDAVLKALSVNPNFIGARVRGEERTSLMAVGVAHELARDYLRSEMVDALAVRLADFTSLNGERDEDNADEWDEALSDEVGSILQPYVSALSQDWLYPHVDDSQLHKPGEIQTFAQSFAEEVWKQLTYKRTTAQILAGVGIADGDILKFIQSYKQPKPQELHNVSQLNSVLNKIMLSFPDDETLEEMLDSASDSDDALAAGGAMALGIDHEDIQVLRRERIANGDGAIEKWAFLIVAGEILPVAQQAENASLPQIETSPPPPPEAPKAAPEAPPVPLRKRSQKGEPPPNAISQKALLGIKNFANIKDDELASIFGVSRPTMSNYMRGKGFCVPTPAQRATLLAFVDKHLVGLQEARDALIG
jgi:hypothetical protein